MAAIVDTLAPSHPGFVAFRPERYFHCESGLGNFAAAGFGTGGFRLREDFAAYVLAGGAGGNAGQYDRLVHQLWDGVGSRKGLRELERNTSAQDANQEGRAEESRVRNE